VSSSFSCGAAGIDPDTLPAVVHCPSLVCSSSVDAGSELAVRPAATTTRVPVGPWTRGTAHTVIPATRATTAATIQRTFGLGS
jgi:hypothetical protein